MQIRNISINSIVEGYSPRRDFSRSEELKKSIEKEGLLEPLLARRDGEKYIVIDGVMRLRVVRELDWKEVDCIIIDADEEKSYHLAYVKNTERKNLNPIEVALHLQTVKDKFGYNNEELVRQGYAPHRSTIDDKLSLLSLPEEIQGKIIEGPEIGPSHGYELAKVKDQKSQRDLFDKTVANGMSVRRLKREIRSLNVQRERERDEILPQVEIPQGDIPGVFFKDSSDMSEMQDETVALMVTSPGYCVGMEYEKNVIVKDHLKNLKQHCKEWNRVLMKGGIVAVNFGDIHNFRTQNGGKVEIQLMGHYYQTFLRKHNIRLRDVITWRKGKTWINNPQVSYHQKTKHTSYRILNNFEYIYVFYKEGGREVPFDIEYESKISKEEWKKWVDGVWEIPPVRKQEGHPAQFPEEIPRRLIRMYSYKGDLVLDCFGGTMTTVKVANELGRIGIGYEKEEKYKPVIMEKLGLTKEDLKKPEVDEDGGTHQDAPRFINKFEGIITEILAENNKTTKDVVSVRLPVNSSLSKDEIEIDWVKDDEEPDPSGPTASLQLLKADDYEESGIVTGDDSPSSCQKISRISNRVSDISPHLNKIILGDCLNKLKDLPDNSVDLIATDPPYGLKFMGKNWDKAVPTVEIWKEALRVLKPGAFAFVMSIPRQDCQSRMIRNLENAGFEVNFSPVYWTYAQGFPKAYNISKGIEGKLKLGTADWSAWRNLEGEKGVSSLGYTKLQKQQGYRKKDYSGKDRNVSVHLTTPKAQKFEGSYAGFQPKPAVEVIIVAMKPMDEKTYVGQALKNGKGITWMDDCRIPYADDGDKEQYAFNMDGNQRTRKESGQRLKLHDGGWKVDKRKKDLPKGRFPANLLISDNVLDDGKKHPGGGAGGRSRHGRGEGYGFKPMGKNTPNIPKDKGGYSRFFSLDAWAEKNLPFLIVPKASKNEKNAGCENIEPKNIDRTNLSVKCKKCGKYPVSSDQNNRCQCENPEWEKTKQHNFHPTVKPIKLMSYLITMGSREQEVVLDIFAGSGSTCIAAKMLNRKFIGMELDEEYQQIAEKRVQHVAMAKAA